MNIVFHILAVLSMAVGLCAAVCLLVLLLASAPNSTPEFLAKLQWGMIATAIGAIVVLGVSIWLMASGRPLWATVVGASPVLWMLGLFIWVDWTSSR